VTRLRAGSATDVGRIRQNNEDSLLVSSPLFAVADGMGGHAAGEVASGIAVETLAERFRADHSANGLADAVRAANRAVWERAQAEHQLRGMGTTLTAVALVEDGDEEVLAVVNVGDSRAYRMQDGTLEQLTEDHSLVEELVRSGRLSSDEAHDHPQKHVLTRVLGIEAEVDVDCFRVVPAKGDRFLLASDGLFNEVGDDGIAATLSRLADPDEAARTLVDMAKKAGGADNITVVVVDVVDGAERPAAKAGAAVEEAGTPAVVRALADRARTVKRSKRLTLRTALFVAVVLLILVAAVAAVGVFARGAYFVGFDDDENVVIYKGRPGGLLWFDPTVEQRTDLGANDVDEGAYHQLREGKEEPSLGAARRYVENLRKNSEAMRRHLAEQATTTTTERPSIP
jgi:serine/threonine protein phosphatase PrpC